METENKLRLHMLTCQAAAKQFNIAYSFVRSLANKGQVNAVRVGKNKIYVSEQSLYTFLANSVIKPRETIAEQETINNPH